MHAFLLSVGVVALSEIGDKTQLFAMLLAARTQRPWPIIAGILIATIVNHAIAGWIGQWLAHLVDPMWMRWVLGVSFLAMAIWTLIPDKLDRDPQRASKNPALGLVTTTAIAFFFLEIGDKTQIATVALAAQTQQLASVVIGTTIGMMAANIPAVFLGEAAANRLPLKAVRIVAAFIFLCVGIAALVQAAL